MSAQVLQPTRAFKVIASNFCDVPYPDSICSGTVTAIGSGFMLDLGADFIASGVSAGDIIYVTDVNYAVTVVDVIDQNTLKINDPDSSSSNNLYTIYKGGQNRGCTLYIGATGDIHVTTAGGDDVTYYYSGRLLPIQVTKVFSNGTGADNIIALW